MAHHVLFLGVSVMFATLIVYSGVVHEFIAGTQNLAQVGSFVAGLFFTSIFTTAPAIAVLGEISQDVPLWSVALIGGLGAVCGDLVIFSFVKKSVSKDVEYILQYPGLKRLRALFRTRLFHRLLPFIGALVIASPLPDELGLAILGMSHISKDRFLLISFVMNAAGIFLIGAVARSVSL